MPQSDQPHVPAPLSHSKTVKSLTASQRVWTFCRRFSIRAARSWLRYFADNKRTVLLNNDKISTVISLYLTTQKYLVVYHHHQGKVLDKVPHLRRFSVQDSKKYRRYSKLVPLFSTYRQSSLEVSQRTSKYWVQYSSCAKFVPDCFGFPLPRSYTLRLSFVR